MKTKSFMLLLMMVVSAGIFTSCEQNTPNEDNRSLGEGNLVSTLRNASSSSLGTFEVYPYSGYVYDTGFTFTFYSSFPHFANPRVRVFVKFNSPLGFTGHEEMHKIDVSSSGVIFQFMKDRFREVGTYRCEIVFSIDGDDPKYPLGIAQSISVNSNAGPAIDDYNSSNNSGYSDRYCTAWVAWKVNQMWGTWNAFPSGLGDAKSWKDALDGAGYDIEQGRAIPGDIIWFSPGTHGIEEPGHVGFVHSVTNSTIYYTDYNGGKPQNKTFGNRKISTSSASDVFFIHVQKQK